MKRTLMILFALLLAKTLSAAAESTQPIQPPGPEQSRHAAQDDLSWMRV